MKSKTILSNCPFCLEKTICSCCGQCINPACKYKHSNSKFSEMSDWYFYQRLVETYSKANLPIETFEDYKARRERERCEKQKKEEENKQWEKEMKAKNPNFFKD